MLSTKDVLQAVEGNARALADLLVTKWLLENKTSSNRRQKKAFNSGHKKDLDNGYRLVYDDIREMLLKAGLANNEHLDNIMERISSQAYLQAKKKYEQKLAA